MFTLRSQTVLVRYGTVRNGKRDVCKQRFIAPYRTVPISASTLGAACLVRYASVQYVKIFACKHYWADAVSLQVVQCIAEGDMSKESAGGMPPWTFFGDSPLPKALKSTYMYFTFKEVRRKRTSLREGLQR